LTSIGGVVLVVVLFNIGGAVSSQSILSQISTLNPVSTACIDMLEDDHAHLLAIVCNKFYPVDCGKRPE
jgi:hypothetical protein